MPQFRLRVATWVAAIGACLSWSAASVAQDIAPFSLSAAELYELAAALPRDDDHAVAVERDVRRFEFDAGHRLRLTHHQIYRIDSAEAVEHYGQVSMPWEPYRQDRPEIRARVVTPGGREHVFDAETLADETVATRDPRKFDDLHLLRGPLPAIVPGSVVEVFKVSSDKAPQFDHGAAYQLALAIDGPTQRTEITVITPRDMPFRYRTRLVPSAVIEQKEEGDRRIFTLRHGPLSFNWNHIWAEASDQSPILPQLKFSTGESWESVAAAYATLAEPFIRPDEVRSLLPADLPGDPRQKLARLLEILHERVRYTGVFFGRGDIVPNPPSVTLERRFGDCKDKAVVLASMLRAAGLPAEVALVNSGTGLDIDPELPGLGDFNHMIVLVPGDEPLWIDATAEYLRAGEAPYENAHRWALPIGETPRGLVRTPEARPEQRQDVEVRTIRFADMGHGDVHVENRVNGTSAASYREMLQRDAKATRKGLVDVYRDVYSAKSVSDLKVTESANGTELTLTMDIEDAEPVDADAQEAGIVMSIEDLFNGLPEGLRKPAATGPDDRDDEDAGPEASAETRTLDWVFEPFVSEMQVSMIPPKGFKLRALPKSEEKAWGPVVFTQSFREEPDGSLSGTMRVNSTRGRYTAEEGRAFRKAFLADEAAHSLAVRFDHEAWTLARRGDAAAALRLHEALVAEEPRKAVHRVRAAAQLLEFGLVEEAKAQALQATKLEPKSAWAHDMLGFVLTHDELGRRFSKGFDRAGALRAYREAVRLDPDNMDMRLNLALTAEWSADGQRYGQGTDLDLAIEQYRAIVAEVPQWAEGTDLLVRALWQAGRYGDIAETAAKADDGSFAANVRLAARVMEQGPEVALREDAARSNAAEHRRRLAAAMGLLMLQRFYDEARALLAVSGKVSDDPEVSALEGYLENLVRVDELPETPATATGAAQAIHQLMFKTPLEEEDLAPYFSEKSRTNGSFDWVHEEFATATRIFAAMTGQEFFDAGLVRDLILSALKFQEAPFAGEARRVVVTFGGRRMGTLYFIQEGGRWKLLSMYPYGPQVAREALRVLDAGDVAGARAWLQDVRTELDGFANAAYGPYRHVLATLSVPGALDDVAALRLAALGLYAVTTPQELSLADVARVGEVTAQAQREALEMVRFQVAEATKGGATALAAAERYEALKPGSSEGQRMLARAHEIAGQWAEAERISRAWLEERPGDAGAKYSLVSALNGQGRYTDALALLAVDAEQGNAKSGQLNNYAWQALLAGRVDAAAVKAVESAHVQNEKRDYSTAHTLACVYAAQGRIAEARRVLLQIFVDNPHVDPRDSAIWLVRGLIAEALGRPDTASKAYRAIEKPKFDRPDSAYGIAQIRLAGLP